MPLDEGFVEPPLPTGAMGWSFWRDSKHNGFDVTKRGLLIGFDMISLRGLAACEVFMLSRGWELLPTSIRIAEPDEQSSSFGVTVEGVPYPRAMAYGAEKDVAEKVRWTLAGWLVPPHNHGQPAAAADLNEFEIHQLRSFWTGWECDPVDLTTTRDKRYRKKYAALRGSVLAIYDRLRVDVAPLVYYPVGGVL